MGSRSSLQTHKSGRGRIHHRVPRNSVAKPRERTSCRSVGSVLPGLARCHWDEHLVAAQLPKLRLMLATARRNVRSQYHGSGLEEDGQPGTSQHPSGERGPPRWIETAGDQEVLTLESVLTLDIAEDEGRNYYYYVYGEEEYRAPVVITSTIRIYDEENRPYGYFDSLAWRVGSPLWLFDFEERALKLVHNAPIMHFYTPF